MSDDHIPWPPVIPPSRAAWWMRVRDLLVTLVAWFMLLWVLRDALLSLAAGIGPEAAARAAAWVEARLRPLVGELVPVPPSEFWQLFDEHLYTAMGFVAMLMLAGWSNRKQLRRQPPAPGSPDEGMPAPLPLSVHFTSAGVEPDAALWQQTRRLHVAFDDDGQITHARADDDDEVARPEDRRG